MSKEKKKYILIGEDFYASDGEIHYITARRLLELYRLNPNECILLESKKDTFEIDLRLAERFNPNAIKRYPASSYE